MTTHEKSFYGYIGNEVTIHLNPDKAKDYLFRIGQKSYDTFISGYLVDTDNNGVTLERVVNVDEYEMLIASTNTMAEANRLRLKYVFPTFISWGVIVAITE
jgi:hypothetical protein